MSKITLDRVNVQPIIGADGRPIMPSLENLRDRSGQIKKQFRDTTQVDTRALDAMRADALRGAGTQSLWRQIMQQRLNQQAGQAAAAAQGQSNAAMNRLAMTGGLRGGASERLAEAGMQQGLLAQQNVLGRGIDLDVQDEQNRLSQLGAVNQASLAQANFERQGRQFNIQNSLNEVLQQRAAQMNAFNEAMRAWASEKTAQATPSGGGGKK